MIKQDNKLENEKCSVEFYVDGGGRQIIRGADKTDLNNEPRFFTRNVRGIKRGWLEIKEIFNENTTEWDCMRILDKHKLNCHSYCGVD